MVHKSDIVLEDGSVDLIGDVEIRDHESGSNTLSIESESGTMWSQGIAVGDDPTSRRNRVTIRAPSDDGVGSLNWLFEALGGSVVLPEDSRVTVNGHRGEIVLGGNGRAGRLVLLDADGTEGVEITPTGQIAHVDNTGMEDLLRVNDVPDRLEEVDLEMENLRKENEDLKAKIQRLETETVKKLDENVRKLRDETISNLRSRLDTLEGSRDRGPDR